MPPFQSLRIDQAAVAVAEIVLAGPGRSPAMGPDFWRELPAAVAALEGDPALRAVVVRGDGGQFSYGLDLAAMAADLGSILGDGAAGRPRIIELARRMHEGFAAIAASRLPFVAAVDGWCIGAGVELICACDLRVAAAGARFALREVKVGIVPDLGGIQRLPHLVGEGWARRLALTGAEIDADSARRIGLVEEVAADGAAALAAARGLAVAIAANPPLVVAGIKQVMHARTAGAVADGNREAATLNGMLLQVEDFAEAMRAFMERRAPAFRGR